MGVSSVWLFQREGQLRRYGRLCVRPDWALGVSRFRSQAHSRA